jgi:hypothetical protein
VIVCSGRYKAWGFEKVDHGFEDEKDSQDLKKHDVLKKLVLEIDQLDR